jgi:flap endonuclease-1
MGVNLRDLLHIEQTTIQRFSGQIMLVDSYNILYQFLAGMRQSDGDLLRDSQNRVTSHLNGLFFRTINLMREGLQMAFIFDGKPHELKYKTIKARIAVKEKAKEEWKLALEAGDMEKARSQAQRTSRITKEMLQESKHLLDLMGVPHVQAPSEGEAQASHMVLNGKGNAVVSQDFDSVLFGAPVVARNLAVSGRRKLPGKRAWINSPPEVIDYERTLSQLEVTREQLVDVAIMVGTDFNPGVKGIGPKKGLKLVKKYGGIQAAVKGGGLKEEIPELEQLRQIFLEPTVTDDYELNWGELDRDAIIRLLCDEHDFSRDRVNRELDKLEKGLAGRSQKTLESFFG